MLTRLQLLKKRAVDAAKDMRLFASFVADTEFFAEQNPECFCSKKAADAYSGLWFELEIVNACALSDCEKEEPGAHQGIWDAKYRADARLAISRLVGYLDSQAGQIPGGVRAKAGADGTECEPAQIATELGLLEGFGRRLGGLLGAAPGHRVSLNH